MFQTEIKFITDFTVNNVKKLGAFFTFEKLLDTNIHPAIKQYLNAEFEYLIYEDRQKLIEKSLFDYSGARISHYFAMISDEIKKTKKVSFEDIKILISRAVSFNVSYVIKPNWSLQKLVFGDKKSISVGELELAINYPYYYDYFKNVFRAYLSKRNLVTISATEFELIMNKVDRELFSAHFEKLVDNSISSIADFFSIGGLNKRSISVEAVEIFLKEKNLIDHLLKLKRAIPDPARKKYDVDDIRKIIFSATSVEPDTISPMIEDELPSQEEFEKVKTLEEAEIKPLTDKADKIIDEKSDDNIIQEIVSEEIVKHDIEELIDIEDSSNAEPEEEFILDETEEIVEEKPVVEEKEISFGKVSKEITEEYEPVQPEKLETIIDENLIPDLNNDSDNSETPVEEEILDILSEDIEEEKESPLLSDKEEEDLFSFYEEELKDLPDKIEDEEIINLDELEIKSEVPAAPDISARSKDEDIELPAETIMLEDETERVEPHIDLEDIESELTEEDKKAFTMKKPRDIFSFLTSKEIDKITDSIFSSDSEDFANTIERISECENYEKATEILKALFTSSKISPQSKQAVLLTNAVANYFDQV